MSKKTKLVLTIVLIDYIVLGLFIPFSPILGFSLAIIITVIAIIVNNDKINMFSKRPDVVIEPVSCPSCKASINSRVKYCPICGAALDPLLFDNLEKKIVVPKDFDPMYSMSEDKMLYTFIKKEIKRISEEDKRKHLIPRDLLIRKNVLNIIFGALLFIYFSLIPFHFPDSTYGIGFIILIVFFIYKTTYTHKKYIIKEVKSRPSEKISNIIYSMREKSTFNTSFIIGLSCFICGLFLPIIIFDKPTIFYEKVDGGYAVRYYLYGYSNKETVNIPSEYKGKPVVSLRGNAFSNMEDLVEVNLPDTITEIRGQAFLNDVKLKNIKLPSNLKTLGGRAFYNCTSLESIVLPDTLTELGGESFYNNVNLKTAVLSKNLSEIRGSTFENCTSLKSIDIPDNVIRIGGHAFRGDKSLSKVNISFNSKLNEIGSSAFRGCYSLATIYIPSTAYVNEKAFKNTSTKIYYFKGDKILNPSNSNKNISTTNSNSASKAAYKLEYGKTVYTKASNKLEITLTDIVDGRVQIKDKNVSGIISFKTIDTNSSFSFDLNESNNYYFNNMFFKITPSIDDFDSVTLTLLDLSTALKSLVSETTTMRVNDTYKITNYDYSIKLVNIDNNKVSIKLTDSNGKTYKSYTFDENNTYYVNNSIAIHLDSFLESIATFKVYHKK